MVKVGFGQGRPGRKVVVLRRFGPSTTVTLTELFYRSRHAELWTYSRGAKRAGKAVAC